MRDLTYLSWSMGKDFSGEFTQTSLGAYYKTVEILEGTKKYYKASRLIYGQGFGDESIYEVLFSRVMKLLGIPCVEYQLIHAKIRLADKIYETHICESKDFAKSYLSRRTFEKFVEADGDSVDVIIAKYGFQKMINQIIVADYLTLNFDRHGANVEMLLDTNGNYELAPLFDNGNSFFSPYPSIDKNQIPTVREYDVTQNKRLGNHFLGAKDLLDSLCYVKGRVAINRVVNERWDTIFQDMEEILPDSYKYKIVETLTKRLSYLEEVGLVEFKKV